MYIWFYTYIFEWFDNTKIYSMNKTSNKTFIRTFEFFNDFSNKSFIRIFISMVWIN